jgi:flotillin
MRGGTVTKSGQGLSIFKWPWESVSIVSTAIRKLSFVADQVTLEKAGVAVTGLAVYRVVEPLLAFRMLDGDGSMLSDILRDMFVGATRRIVAGLTLDECLTHRKERVATALMAEVAPVLAGSGNELDETEQGWGVVLDTIEIQDVRVLSEEVFARMQAPYREALALEALRARDQVEREAARFAADRLRSAEQAKRELMAEEEARVLAERKREVEAAVHGELIARRKQEAELTLKQARAEADRSRAAIEQAARKEAGELEADLERLKRAALTDLSEARLREISLTQTMPQLAQAFRNSFDRIQVTTTDADPFAVLGAGIERVMRATQK